MGAGASAASPAVKEACKVLFKEQRISFEALVASEASPEKIVEFISQAGKSLNDCAVQAAQANSKANLSDNAHKPSQRGLAKGKPKRGQGKGGGRRRSYGAAVMDNMSKPSGNRSSSKMAESASEPTLDAVEAAAAGALAAAASQLEAMKQMNAETSPVKGDGDTTSDHWDSVRDLPYCEDCQMAFKTQSALTRHVKYSNLHETTIAKKKAAAEAAAGAEEKITNKASEFLARQEEGKDFRLLYFGSKFFWRTQDNIDLSFYQHILMHIIEVIPFDVHKNKEMSRIYLDKFKVDTALDEEVKKACAKKKQDLYDEAAKSKFTVNIDWNEDTEYHAMQRIMCTSYILARLNLQETLEGKKHSHKLLFHTLNSDDPQCDPLLKELPENLVPVSVTHRRNSSAEEVKAKLEEVNVSQNALRQSIGKAEKISGMVQNFIQMTKQSRALQTMPLAKKRFVMAVRKVMQINGVEKTKIRLKELAEAKVAVERKVRRLPSQHRET